MTVGELKKSLETIPDDKVVMVQNYDMNDEGDGVRIKSVTTRVWNDYFVIE